MAGVSLEPFYNLGSGSGTSVGEIMSAVASVTGVPFEPEFKPRRKGDPSRIVADGTMAARDLGWKQRHTVEAMVASAWSAYQAFTS
jgi:UDP-glucose 4-epimerase